jgi:VIT1/CCC1 family predicted Fe2+/Mn2+ transporter
MRVRKKEAHKITRIGWLRAAVLGANDGIISTSSLMLGIGSASGHSDNIVFAGVAAMVAGAMSMAAGEYVSVSSQSDAEKAALDEERHELESDAAAERRELAAIYVKRGVEPPLARQVAAQMMDKDALGAHAREELGQYDSELPAAGREAEVQCGRFGKHAQLGPIQRQDIDRSLVTFYCR